MFKSRKIALLLIITLIISGLPLDGFVYAAGAPEITSITLIATTNLDGTQTMKYEIYGKNFDKPTFWIDGRSIGDNGYEIVDGAYLIIRTPDNNDLFEEGLHEIDVVNQDGTQSTEALNFTAKIAPWVTSVSKNKVYIGESLEITGTGFETGDVVEVNIGGRTYLPGEFTIVNSKTIKIPEVKSAQFPRNGDIKVVKETNEGHEIQGRYKGAISVVGKLDGVEVEKIVPNAGSIDGGTKIRILGKEGQSNFTDDMKIYMNKVSENNKFSDVELIYDEKGNLIGIAGVTPPSPTGEQGVFPIIITDNTGANELQVDNAFTYEQMDNLLKLTSITPSYGKGIEESESVEVSGRNIVTLNTPNIVSWTVNDAVYSDGMYYDSNRKSLFIHYTGKYDVPDTAEDNVDIVREVKLILGKATEITDYQMNQALDKVTAKVPSVTEIGPVDVTMQTTTTVKYKDTGEYIFSMDEEYTLSSGFTFLPATTIPTITSVEPSKGPIDGLIYLTIKGSNFQVLSETDESGNIITKYPIIHVGNKIIDPNKLDSDDIDDSGNQLIEDPDWMKVYDDESNEVNGIGRVIGTVIKTAIPATGDKDTVGLVDITIINPDLGENFYDNAFEFLKPERDQERLPVITKISPNIGPLEGGNTITIEGDNFDYQAVIPDVTVTIDGQQAEIVKASKDKIEVIVPSGISIGEKNVQVITEDGAIVTNDKEGNGYTYIRLVSNPEIEKIVPAFGGAGTVVYIFGKDKGPDEPNFFAPITDPDARVEEKIGTRVLLNGIDINDMGIDPEVDQDKSNYEKEMTDGKIGDIVDLNGDGDIYDGQSNVKVIDRNTLRIVIPEGYSAGLKDVTILNPDTSTVTLEDSFNYKIPPQGETVTIDSIDPNFGSHRGGMYVTIRGSNFKPGAKVFFGGKEATNVNVNGNRDAIYLKTPEYIIPNPDLIPSISVDVTVVNYDGSNVTAANGYEYMVPASDPVITDVEPSEGTTIGNEYVSIEGADFRKFYDASNDKIIYPKVYFGTERIKEENVMYISDTELYVKTPFNGNEGSVDITVINPDAGTAIKENAFTYKMTKPVIDEVIPARGHKIGGEEITIKGKDILAGNFSDELKGELLKGDVPKINVLAIFGDEKDEDKVIIGKAKNILSDITIDYNVDRQEVVELYDGSTTTDSVLIYHKDIEKPIASYDLQPEERHIFILDWETILGEELSAEGVSVELRDDTLISRRRIAPRAEVLDAMEEDGTRTLILETPPSQYIGEKNLYIENKDRGSTSTIFEYVNPASDPVIETITPRTEVKNQQGEVTKYYVESTIEGGMYITIEGYDFRKDVEVFIDGVPATLVSRIVLTEMDDKGRLKTRIVVKSPKGSEKEINKEKRIVIVNQDGGFVDSTMMEIPYYFVYRIPESSPYIESILPTETSQAGGNKIRIVGYDFRTGAKVLVDGTECTIDYIDNDEIIIITPTNLTPGLKDVQVINVDFGTITKEEALKVVSYPQITTVTTEGGETVDRVSIEGGQRIVLTGKNFRSGAKVFFGGTRKSAGSNIAVENKGLFADDKYYQVVEAYEATKVEFVDEHQMIVTVPEVFKEGDYTITIINSDGGLSDDNKILKYTVPIPSDPTGLKAEIVNDKYIRIYGYTSNKASYYEIYAYLGDDYPDDEDFKYLDMTEKTSYKITKFPEIDEDENIYLRIRAVNKYGPSEWSNIVKIDYEDELKDIDGIGEEDRDGDLRSDYQETMGGDGVNVVLGNEGLRGSEYSYYVIDLNDSKYKDITKRVINVPGKIIKESSRVILVDNGDSRLQFTPRNFYTYTFYNKSSSEQTNTYGQIIIEKMKGSYSDYIERKIPRKYELVSKIFNIETNLQTGKNAVKLDNISGEMDIELSYDENRLIGLKEDGLQIYRFDSEKVEWIPLAGGADKEKNRVHARIYGPGQYAILGKRF